MNGLGSKCGCNRNGRRLWALLAGVLLLSLFGCAGAGQSPEASAEKGILDLRDRSFQTEGVLPLSGEWSFVWYAQGHTEPIYSTIDVPKLWSGVRLEDGTKLSSQGRGVYRLTILHERYDGMLAIRLPNISTAYTLYVNGVHKLSLGQAGSGPDSTRPYQLPSTVYFDGSTGRTELELIVSNFDHRNGGVRTDLIVGTDRQIENLDFSRQSQEMVVFGCLTMIGFYHLGLFALRRRETANLYFALMCFFVSSRMGVIGDGLFFHWIPSLTWTAGTRIEYTSFALSALFGFAYYSRTFFQEIGKRWVWLSRIAGIVLVACCWTVPVLQVSAMIVIYQIYVLLLSARTLAGLVLALYRKREGARLALFGVAGLVVTIVNDIFFYNGWWRSLDLAAFGLLFLILLNSFSISLRFSRTFVRSEQMSSELKEWNNLLEEKIAERTEQLTRSYAELEESKGRLERMELSRRQLVSNISHDLRTPITLLQGYLEAIRDGVIHDPNKLDSAIRLMLTKVQGLNSLIQDLFDLSLLEARRAPMAFAPIRLADWLRRLAEEYEPELKEKGIAFSASGGGDHLETSFVRIDEHQMDRVLANLIYNSLKHTPRGGSIALTVTAEAGLQSAKVQVADTGSGIHPDDLPHIFERFYPNDTTRRASSGGSGLGLSIAKEIVEMHGGRLTAENADAGGSVLTIQLPLLPDGR
ncbi:sensor histidine kinase [Cohnella lubricantis]|uniref:histidine kinase n=1 Tax=Cohnella lubricantis TaxID=2163172 RepID=A0A841TB12_9BACL|nr:sensor histidine kinase [Cohnella lubricantis]MBB6676578.1 sensor histidine kinase [Cohnella lubricantis]MBP2117411.1 signal transduction histidine kinase [Cohnella lubricantis]